MFKWPVTVYVMERIRKARLVNLRFNLMQLVVWRIASKCWCSFCVCSPFFTTFTFVQLRYLCFTAVNFTTSCISSLSWFVVNAQHSFYLSCLQRIYWTAQSSTLILQTIDCLKRKGLPLHIPVLLIEFNFLTCCLAQQAILTHLGMAQIVEMQALLYLFVAFLFHAEIKIICRVFLLSSCAKFIQKKGERYTHSAFCECLCVLASYWGLIDYSLVKKKFLTSYLQVLGHMSTFETWSQVITKVRLPPKNSRSGFLVQIWGPRHASPKLGLRYISILDHVRHLVPKNELKRQCI